MSVYLLPVAASSAMRRASLYRSAPPLIMEAALNGIRTVSPIRPSVAPFRSVEPIVEPESQRVTHAKRKRRVRAQRHAAGSVVATNAPRSAPLSNPTPSELGISTPDEADKQAQNEDKDLRTGKKLLAKHQLQRANLLPEVTGPKKRANRDGNYRCLH